MRRSGGLIGEQPLIPLSKVAVLTYDEQDHDPRGNSALRPLYGPWWCKQQTMPSLLAYIARFGQPSVVGKMPPNVAARGIRRLPDSSQE